MPDQRGSSMGTCTLLLFVATPAEEEALELAAREFGLPFEHDRELANRLRGLNLADCRRLGQVGNEIVIAVRPSRERGRVIMGSHGRLGSAEKAIQLRQITGARGIIQLGMAFGIDPARQRIGDVLVSAALVPYDNRNVVASEDESYIVTYPHVSQERAREALVGCCIREQKRGGQPYGIHLGALLSGAARIHSRKFRDELACAVPVGEYPIVGGEMEGVGLLAASLSADDPIWCVVKGISDFADEDRDRVIADSRPVACLTLRGSCWECWHTMRPDDIVNVGGKP